MVETTTSTTHAPSLFEQISTMGHENVVFCYDDATGLKAIIGVHNTVLGPALGGTRMWVYENEADAVRDALRLSRGMTFKNAIAGLNLGGGKAVIIGDARTQKNEALLRRFGKFVQSLNGKYITAEDVGMNERDMDYIAMETQHVTGLAESRGGAGDPSPYTALGTYVGMKAAAKVAYGNDSLAGKKVAIQGAGNVGEHIIAHLEKEGATIFVTDIYADRLQAIAKKYKVEIVGKEDIYDLDVDIYAPCALGATVNDQTLSRLKCQIIAGCANNQLQDEKRHGDACLEKGIIYVPDFLINAGGVINVYSEYAKLPNEWVVNKTESLYDACLEVLKTSLTKKQNAQEVAIAIAQKRIDTIAKIKTVR
ncbi:Glu/Leu/Phe/Val family dehydrogenase [Hugenholtzia roseola]|uniref:Glu/Leu/Phe/Val family dehydrogenase n=1 Tax=Hugenholtzia roseola TaxID=1002 RepID=UPI000418A3AE|nr:Glu/Leu/Phe/Val dehydrogenase [Hugenholtzia roseola]